MRAKSWPFLIKLAKKSLEHRKLSEEYSKRLDFEIKEIEKQGANRYWLNLFNARKDFNNNKNGLVLPFLLGITLINPIEEDIPHIVKYHPDFPDIDIDFLPFARESVKEYAEEQYGSDFVCSVGMWIRYKTRLALQDSATALGLPRRDVIALCKNLPDEFDEMSIAEAREEFPNFNLFAEENPELVTLAYGMSGKIKAQSKHAGGLIISSVPIKDYVPMTFSGPKGNKQWRSAWTEGMAETQLSKFGFIKFDILGLINIAYIWTCKRMIEKHKGIKISFDDIDPEENRIGWIEYPDGTKKKISLNDEKVLKIADELKLTSIFQFDTDFQQSVVEKGGVKSFMDLVIYTSLGRPGPLPMIDVYIKNRDDKNKSWMVETHPIMQDILEETHGVLTFQEQLLRTWTELCGFTMPEAEAAQKAVKKKRISILEEIGPKVIEGAAREIGQEAAEKLWSQMISFGRYCFNKCLSADTILVNPITGEQITVEELYLSKRSFKLQSYDGYKSFVGDVNKIHYNGKQEVYEIEFSHGLKQVVTKGHKFMNEFGKMEEVSSLIETGHAIKYIRGSVTDVQENKRQNRITDCKTLPKQENLQANYSGNWGQVKQRHNNKSNKKTRREEKILNQSDQHGRTPLLRNNRLAGKSLLVGNVDSRWVYSRNKRICELAASPQRPRFSKAIWDRLEIAKKNVSLSQKRVQTDAAYGKQQKDGCGFETSWCYTREVHQGNHSGCSFHVTPIKRADGWGRMYYGQFKGVSDDQDWIEFCLFRQTEDHFSFRMWGKSFKDNRISEQFLCYLLDWLISDTSDSEISLSRCHKISNKEEANGRCYIVSIKSLGIKKTYSPETKSSCHNYITTPQNNEVIHANSHAVGYIIISYCCLWLKTYFPSEWWAATLSLCPPHKFVRFMGVARSEGIPFGLIDVNNLEANFTVQGNKIVPGIARIKGIGKNKAPEIVAHSKEGDFEDIDHFVKRCGKGKLVLERLIKLGGFDALHKNRRAIWLWYMYRYGTGPDCTKLRKLIKYCYAWPEDKIFEERQRQLKEYRGQYPNRRKMPPKILNWYPAMPWDETKQFQWNVDFTEEQEKAVSKIRLKREHVLKLFPNDFTLQERLMAEKEYLGYYWSSPLDMFIHSKNTNIEDAKITGVLECVIEETHTRSGSLGQYLILNITDGVGVTRVNVWGREVANNDAEVFEIGTGIRAEVIWKEQYKSFSVRNNSFIVPLEFADEDDAEDWDLLEEELDHYEQLSKDFIETK